MVIKVKPIASVLIPVILMFFILIYILIATQSVVLIQKGFEGNWKLSLTMSILIVLNLGLLVGFVKMMKEDLNY